MENIEQNLQEEIEEIKKIKKESPKIIKLLKKILNWKIITGIATIICAIPIIYNIFYSEPKEERILSEINKNNIQIKESLKSQKELYDCDSIPFIKAVKEYNECLSNLSSAITIYYDAYDQEIDYVTGYSSIRTRVSKLTNQTSSALNNAFTIALKEKLIHKNDINIQEVVSLIKKNEESLKQNEKYILEFAKDLERLAKKDKNSINEKEFRKKLIEKEIKINYDVADLNCLNAMLSFYLKYYNLFNEIITTKYSL